MPNSDKTTDRCKIDIAVLIPCYNEAKTIGKVVSDFKATLPDARIYVYDNNSTDNTAHEAESAGAIVRRESRQGKGNVIKSMFYEIDADVYLMVDGDDTYPAETAKELIAPIIDGKADMVVGDRLSTTYFTENKRAFHNCGNVLVRKAINRLFSSDIHDILSGYRAFSRDFVKNFPILAKGFEIETEMTIHALDKNLRIREVPVDYRDRPVGSESKLNTISDGYKVLKTIFSLFKDYRPMAFFSTIALLLLAIGMIMFVSVFIEYVQTGLVPRFPSLITSVGFLLAAILNLVVGIIADAITKQNRRFYELLRIQNSLRQHNRRPGQA